MAGKDVELVPINQIQSDRLLVGVTLPKVVDSSRIGVNVTGLERLSELAGIRRLTIKSVEDGRLSKSDVPIVVGFNDRGEAVAGKAAEAELVPLYRINNGNNQIEDLLFQRSKWRDAKIGLNVEEMNRLIVADTHWEGGMRSTEAWSHYLEQVIKAGVKDTGYQNLMNNASAHEKGININNTASIIGSNLLNGGIAYLFSGEIPLTVLGISATVAILIDQFYLLEQRHNVNYLEPLLDMSNYPKKFRYSLTYGPEWERYLRLKLNLSRTPLVSPIEN